MSSKAPKAPSKQTSTTEPWKKQQPFLEFGFGEARELYDQPGPSYFPGRTVAYFDPAEVQGQRMALNFANSVAPQQAANAQQALNFQYGAPNINQNPYIHQAANAAVRPIFQSLTEEALPSIRSGSTLAGQYGSSRQAVAEALATDRAMRTAGDVTANMFSTAYGQGLDAQGRALALAPEVQKMSFLPSQITSAVGETRRGMTQAETDAAVARHNYNQGLPYQKLAEFMDTIQGNYGGASTVRGGGTAAGTKSPIAGALGGAMSGLSIGAQVGGPAVAPWAAGIGAIMGLFG